jgi:hypothetical protein
MFERVLLEREALSEEGNRKVPCAFAVELCGVAWRRALGSALMWGRMRVGAERVLPALRFALTATSFFAGAEKRKQKLRFLRGLATPAPRVRRRPLLPGSKVRCAAAIRAALRLAEHGL